MGLFNRTKEEPGQTLPSTDAERWIAGTYAIWSEYCGGSCQYLGGYEKNKSNAKMLKKVLWEDWAVKDHENGVEMVQYLLDNAGPSEGDQDAADTTAFDYACACNLCGRLFIAGIFTREESLRYAAQAARKIQQQYRSWEEYFSSYILGAAGGGSNISERAPFEEAYQQVQASAASPLGLDWNTSLESEG